MWAKLVRGRLCSDSPSVENSIRERHHGQQRASPGGGGGDPSVLDANYPPPPTNCWPEAPWGGGVVAS